MDVSMLQLHYSTPKYIHSLQCQPVALWSKRKRQKSETKKVVFFQRTEEQNSPQRQAGQMEFHLLAMDPYKRMQKRDESRRNLLILCPRWLVWPIFRVVAGNTSANRPCEVWLEILNKFIWDYICEYNCDQCGRVIGSNIRLKRQIEIKHTDTNCESCDKEYKSNMGQRYHMKRSTEATLFNVQSKKSWCSCQER